MQPVVPLGTITAHDSSYEVGWYARYHPLVSGPGWRSDNAIVQDMASPGNSCDCGSDRVGRRRPGDHPPQNPVKYFLDLNPGEKRFVRSSVTYKRRKVGPELNAEKKREPL